LSSSEFVLWSHPHRLLVDHLSNVLANGRGLYDDLGLEPEMRRALDLCLLLHDLGKATDYFQTYIHAIADRDAGAIDEAALNRIRHELGFRKNHARLSAFWVCLQARPLFGADCPWPLLAFLAVLKHHGDLRDLEDMSDLKRNDDQLREDLEEMSAALNYDEMGRIAARNGYPLDNFNHAAFLKALNETFYHYSWRRQLRRWREAAGRDNFWRLSLMFSTLLSCDKGECIFRGAIFRRGGDKPPADLVDRYKRAAFAKKSDSEVNRLRERVYREVQDNLIAGADRGKRFFSINAPTGLGKTLTALNAALKLIQHRADLRKILYCLPFTSVIDQNADVFADVFATCDLPAHSENLLVYHHLSELDYRARDDVDEIDPYQGEYLVTQFESHINVTTFHQFLHGMFTGKNREIRKLHSLANSVVILDEVQSVPAKYWPLVRKALIELAEEINLVVVLATATMPMIFDGAKGEILELTGDRDALFAAMDRIELDASALASPMTLDAFAQRLIADHRDAPDQSALVVVNTKRAAKDLYGKLKLALGKNRLVFLSTDLPPCERLKRIQAIRESTNPENKNREPLWVVSTQLVEAGVDIDMDRVYRDLGPLDAVFQAAGRCNRNQAKGRGRVHLVDLRDDRDDNGRAFAGYVYGRVELDQTRQALAKRECWPESRFGDLARDYYQAVSKRLDMDDSHHILQAMARLDYDRAFRPSQDNPRAFQLIEQQEVVPALVLCFDEAKARWAEYEALLAQNDLDAFEKKRRIREAYRRLASFIVSIPKKYAPDTEQRFFLITENLKGLEYHEETGVDVKGASLFI